MTDTPTPSPPQGAVVRTERQGFILDEGSCCHLCLDRTKENENAYSLPWLFEGEPYECFRCGGAFRNVG
jgi:hypothetical protein